MAKTGPLKKVAQENWMAQADPPKEASTVKKMNGWSLLLSSNKMAQIKWLQMVSWKIYIVFTKIWCFK